MMEVRMHPRREADQHVVEFELDLSPRAKILDYDDYLGNVIHIFDIPGKHEKLAIKMDTVVEMLEGSLVPEAILPTAWDALQDQQFSREAFDMLKPSHFARTSPAFEQFSQEVDFQKLDDPLSTLRDVNKKLYDNLDYDQTVTTVDSPIEVAIDNRKGVCQDYAHIMLTVVRGMGIPCRYVSGYLYHRTKEEDRSAEDASHAWVEAWLPELGWVGFDPTNNLICGDRHIRACIGQDYDDTAPTKGVFTGDAQTELTVSVQVSRLEALPGHHDAPFSFQLPDYEQQQFQQQQ
jgi:transglutaminase-like putative cysteine protease